MKQYFYFYIDHDGMLCCLNEYMYQKKLLKDAQALKALDITNNINYKKIVVDGNKMSLFSKHNQVTIEDIDSFYRRKYINLLSNVKKVIDCSFRYNLVRDTNYEGICVDNMTFYTSSYKRKIALKSGRVFVLSGLALASSFVADKKIQDLNQYEEMKIATEDFAKTSSSLVTAGKSIDQYIDKCLDEMEEQKRLEEEAALELAKKDYQNFTSYNDESKYAYDNYFDIVYEIATKTGVDPNLVMAMLIQETRGKKSNLMQISYSAWQDNLIEYYDFEEEKYKKIVLTNNKGKYESDVECIDFNDINEPKNNIMFGCLILRENIKCMDNNIMAGVQCYNLGTGNMDHVISACLQYENISREELLNDQNNLAFVDYTKYASGGDKHYIANVSQFLNETDSIYYLDIDDNGIIKEYNYNLKEEEKVYTK